MTPYYSDDLVTLYHGDCREVLPTLAWLLLDALTDAQVLADDSQVVELHVRKCYPGEHCKALEEPGVRVAVWQLNPKPVAA